MFGAEIPSALGARSVKAVERLVGTAERRGGLWGVKFDWPKLGPGILQLLAKGMEASLKARRPRGPARGLYGAIHGMARVVPSASCARRRWAPFLWCRV